MASEWVCSLGNACSVATANVGSKKLLSFGGLSQTPEICLAYCVESLISIFLSVASQIPVKILKTGCWGNSIPLCFFYHLPYSNKMGLMGAGEREGRRKRMCVLHMILLAQSVSIKRKLE